MGGHERAGCAFEARISAEKRKSKRPKAEEISRERIFPRPPSISSLHRRRVGIHSAVVSAVSIFLVNRDLGRAYRGASGVAARQITVINDLDYRYNQNAAASAGPAKKGDRGKKGVRLKNAEGMLAGAVYMALRPRETQSVHVEIAHTRATAIPSRSTIVRISFGLNRPRTKVRVNG